MCRRVREPIGPAARLPAGPGGWKGRDMKLSLPATAVAEGDWDDRLGSKMTVEDREGKSV